MKKFQSISTLISAAVLAIVTAQAAYACPPKVIKTVPDDGQRNVEPSLKQVRIEFDQDMNTMGYSICGGGPNFPKILDKPKWVGKRTLVMAVKLEPNHDYEMSVNCPSYQACRNTQWEPAVIYPIKFRTGSARNKVDEKSKCTVILLQEGLHTEETEGNLDKAMEIYQRAIDESDGNQKVAASATYQLGMCHLKKGDSKEAEEYFQQVVTSYSNEKSVAAKASKRLEELGIRSETPANLFDILGPEVCSHIRSIYKEICVEAGAKKVYSNGPIYLVDDNFVLHRGGMGYITNCTGATINKRHRMCGTSYPFQKLYDVQGNPLDVEIVEDEQRDGFYDIYWNPKEPLKAGDFFKYRWAMDKSTRLSAGAGDGNYNLVMQNMLGRGGFETFFLVVPEGTIIANQSAKYTAMDNFEGWDIYWWKKEVEANENHTVVVTLKGTPQQAQIDKIRPEVKKSVFAQIDEQVIRFISEQYGKTAATAGVNHLYSNSHIYYVDPNFELYNGGMNYYYNYTGRTIGVGEKVRLSGTSYSNQTLYDTSGKELHTEIESDDERPDFYDVYWIPDAPLAPNESLYYGWSMDATRKLQRDQNEAYSLTMQNRFGSPVIETFFLVFPKNLKTLQSAAPTGSEKLLNFYVFWWTKEVQHGENHVEDLQIVKMGPSETKKWVQALVEDFFQHNYRDITSRKTIEWGTPITDANGNVSISYKYEMVIWDKDKLLSNKVFTFDKNGEYLKVEDVEGFPKPLGRLSVAPEDVSTKENVQKLVEKFFSRNYRDITYRKTIEWGELNRDVNGNVSIRYKFEAIIWNKDKIIANKVFTFDKNGEYISANDVEGFPVKVE